LKIDKSREEKCLERGMKLRQLRIDLGWNRRMLAKEAGVDPTIVSKAEKGINISAPSAKKIADAFSRAYGREIRISEIEGLNVE
jgi:transcriptional regulator with XRE-family HTH domain